MSFRDDRNAVTEDDTGLLRVDRRVRCRRSIMIARQKTEVGIVHAGRTVAVEEVTRRSGSTTAPNC
jgi:hypothetical protein